MNDLGVAGHQPEPRERRRHRRVTTSGHAYSYDGQKIELIDISCGGMQVRVAPWSEVAGQDAFEVAVPWIPRFEVAVRVVRHEYDSLGLELVDEPAAVGDAVRLGRLFDPSERANEVLVFHAEDSEVRHLEFELGSLGHRTLSATSLGDAVQALVDEDIGVLLVDCAADNGAYANLRPLFLAEFPGLEVVVFDGEGGERLDWAEGSGLVKLPS